MNNKDIQEIEKNNTEVIYNNDIYCLKIKDDKKCNNNYLEFVKIYSLPNRKKITYNLLKILKKENVETIQKIYLVSNEKNKILKKYNINIEEYINSNIDFSIKKEIQRITDNNKYEIKILYYVTEKSKYSLEKLINILETDLIFDDEKRTKILKSIIYQLLVTVMYMYINYGLVHNNLNINNIYVEKSEKKYIEIEVKGIKYNIKLFGYIIKIGGFEKSMSYDLLTFEDYRDKIYYECNTSLNPRTDIVSINEIFIKLDEPLNIINNEIINMIELNNIYKYYTPTTKIYVEKEKQKKNIEILREKYFELFNEIINKDNDILNINS